MDKPLSGRIAVVSGATRGAGRGVARELGAAGAKVYCTGRSTAGHAATAGRPETIEETAALITEAGGNAVAIRVDHTVEAEVAGLAARIRADEGRVDILVNDIWGGDELIDFEARFWTLDMATVRTLSERAILSHLITARFLAPMMVEAKRGLIVEITDGETSGYRGQLLYDLVKASVIRLAYAYAWDLAGTGVTALALTPGFLRSEAMLDRFGVTEANWRDAAKIEPDFALSETPRYLGRAIAALAADPNVGRKAGLVLAAADLADEYGFTDVDGSQPNFWRNMQAWLDAEMARDGDITDPRVRWIAQARYAQIHLMPMHAERAALLRAKVGYDRLGAGLQPFGARGD